MTWKIPATSAGYKTIVSSLQIDSAHSSTCACVECKKLNLFVIFLIFSLTCFTPLQRRRFRRLQSLASYNSIQENDDNQSNRFTRHRNSLLYLLMALYLLRVWGTSRFVINILANRLEFSCTVHYILLILQSYGDSGQGFWNFVIFCCLDETVKFRKLCRLRRYGGGDYTDHERQHLVQEMVESSA